MPRTVTQGGVERFMTAQEEADADAIDAFKASEQTRRNNLTNDEIADALANEVNVELVIRALIRIAGPANVRTAARQVLQNDADLRERFRQQL